MRTLHLVPMIHSDPDLGEAAEQIRTTREKLFGTERLVRHEEVVATFWERVESWLQSLDASRVKIYQDGMVEGGEIGRHIVGELASKGSPNFTCISRLMSAGAEIRKTEDLPLIRKEYSLTVNLIRARSLVQKIIHLLLARLQKRGLLKKRDRYIAHQINTTLQEEELGVLFIGAYHQAHEHLAPDIQVAQFKSPRLIQAYMKALKLRGGEDDLHRLAEELIK